jgi:hypothetical protein
VSRPGLTSSSPPQKAPEPSSIPESQPSLQAVSGPPSALSFPPTSSAPPIMSNGSKPPTSAHGLGSSPLQPPVAPVSLTTAAHPSPGGAVTMGEARSSGPGHLANPFSSPHPTLSPPNQSPNKSRAYHTIYDQASPMSLKVINGQNGTSAAPNPSPERNHAAFATPVHAGNLTRPPQPTTSLGKTSPPVLLAPGLPRMTNATPMASSPPVAPMPNLTPISREAKQGDSSPPLPPSRGGLSPTKHSPPVSHYPAQQTNGSGATNISPQSMMGTSPKLPILPPAATLSPSAPHQILKPPVKPIEPARPVIQQQTPQMQPSLPDTSS